MRNPFSTRPYQHVLEPVYAYLMIAAMQYEKSEYQSWYNVGPDDQDCFQTGALVDLFVKYWGEGLKWVNQYDGGPHEATFLKLDCQSLRPLWAGSHIGIWILQWKRLLRGVKPGLPEKMSVL